jgi:hypothetical protein
MLAETQTELLQVSTDMHVIYWMEGHPSHSGLFVLRRNHALGGILVLLVLTLILVNLKPAQAQTGTVIYSVDAGSGSVHDQTPGGTCLAPSGCTYDTLILLTVTATPSSGWQFSSWSTVSGGVSCTSGPTVNPCQFITPSTAEFTVTIEATFTQTPAPPIPEYPLGLPLLAILALLAYGVIRRRTRNDYP